MTRQPIAQPLLTADELTLLVVIVLLILSVVSLWACLPAITTWVVRWGHEREDVWCRHWRGVTGDRRARRGALRDSICVKCRVERARRIGNDPAKLRGGMWG